jgi:hypothetical protein
MTSNVLQYRHFDLRQTINFVGEPINNDAEMGDSASWVSLTPAGVAAAKS